MTQPNLDRASSAILDMERPISDVRAVAETILALSASRSILTEEEMGRVLYRLGDDAVARVKVLERLFSTAHTAMQGERPDPLISTQDDDGCEWIKATTAEAEMFVAMRQMPEAERLAIIADVMARPLPEEGRASL